MVQAIQRVNLDPAALEWNVSHQAVIKTFVPQALDQDYLAMQGRTR